MAVDGMDDIRLVIGLVRVDGEQIQIGRQQFLGRFPVRLQHRTNIPFHLLIGVIHILRHLNRNGYLLIIGEVLAHIVQREKSGVFQQEPGKHQGRYSGKLAGFGFALAGPAVGIVGGVGGFVGVLHHPVLCVKGLGTAVALAVLAHQTGHQPVQQMENARAVAVDEGGRHAHKLLADAENLRHCVPLAAVVVVLVELVGQESINSSLHLLFDVGTQRKPVTGPFDRETALGIFSNLPQTLQNHVIFCERLVAGGERLVDPAKMRYFGPKDISAWIDRGPQHGAALPADTIFLMFPQEKLQVCIDQVTGAVVAVLHLDGLAAVGAEERPLAVIPSDGGIAHIAVPGLLLAEYRIDAFVSGLVHSIQPLQLCDTLDHHGIGVGQGLPNLPHPLLGDMGGAHDQPKGFLGPAPALSCPHTMQSAQGRGADFRLSRTTFGNDERNALLVQLALDRLGHGQLCVVEGVSRFLLDVVVDSQHLLGQRLGGRVEQRCELVPDAVGHGDAEGVEVTGDVLHALKAVRLVRAGPGNGDSSALQAPLQNLHHVFIVGPQLQHPGVQLLRQGEDLQRPQLAPVDEGVQNSVPELRDEGCGGLAVQLLKEPVSVPGGNEDVALPGLDGLLFAGLV